MHLYRARLRAGQCLYIGILPIALNTQLSQLPHFCPEICPIFCPESQNPTTEQKAKTMKESNNHPTTAQKPKTHLPGTSPSISIEKASAMLNISPAELTSFCNSDTQHRYHHHRTIYTNRIRFFEHDLSKIRNQMGTGTSHVIIRA